MMTPQKKLKILFIIDNYYPFIGGAEILAQKVAEGLVRKNHQITVITSNTKNTEKHEVLNGVNIFRISSNRYTLPFKAFWEVWKESRDCDLIHTSTYSMLPLAWLIKSIRHKKGSVVIHELLGKIWFLDMSKISAFLHYNAERFMIRFFYFNKYIAVSEFTLNQLKSKNIPNDKCLKIYNGIDELPRYSEVNFDNMELFLESSCKLIFAGRPGPSKGVMYLLESIKELEEKKVNVHLLMLLGEEPKSGYKNVIQYIHDNNLNGMITIIKQVPYKDLKAYLDLADVFVLPSLQEGFGILAGQLSLLKKPIVAAKNGALPEVLSGKIVWIPSISSANISKGIEEAIEGNVKDVSEKIFDWQETINQYESVFQELSNES